MEPLRIQLLGGFHVAVGDRPVERAAWRRRKAAAIVKLLALAPGHRLHRDQLADQLWPDRAPDDAFNQLHQTVRWARLALASAFGVTDSSQARELASPYLAFQGADLVLGPAAPVLVDLAAFELAARRARETGEIAHLQPAVDRYTGDLLPEDRYEDWLADRREAVVRQYLELLAALARRRAEAGATDDSVALWQRVLAVEPANEAAHTALMRLYAAGGRRQEALRQFGRLTEALRQDLDVEPDPATRTLYQAILAGEFAASPARAAAPAPPPERERAAPRSNLPAPVNRFVGRTEELQQVAALLAEHRLVTLSGPGGIGKTRTALEAARQLAEHFPDGVWLAEFAPVTDEALVPHALSEVLGTFAESGQVIVESLVNQLRDRSTLLIFDNCEHVIDAAARLAATLLRRCPHLRLLVTSREALRIAGEQVYRVPALRLPAGTVDLASYARPSGEAPATPAADSDAVQLFIERAAAAAAEFQLTPANAAELARICRRLDGIPLAIELAAARLGVESVAAIAAGLDDRFALLTRGSRAALPRQQTLRASLDWSYHLLDAATQRLFRRLAVFAGSFDLDATRAIAAAGVGAGPPQASASVPDQLVDLVDKSLVIADTSGSQTRYRLLETVRQYAWLQLTEQQELTAARDQHVAHYLDLAERAAAAIEAGGQRTWLPRLDLERDNLRTAMEWAQARAAGTEPTEPETRRQRADVAMRLALAQWLYWDVRGAYDEAWQWSTGALAHPGSAPLVIKTHAAAAYAARQRGDLATAREQSALAMALLAEAEADDAEPRQRAEAVGFATVIAAIVASDQGDVTRSEALARAALASFEQAQNRYWAAFAWTWIGCAVMLGSDPASTLPYLMHAMALRREIGDEIGLSIVLLLTARMERSGGHFEVARGQVQEALEIARAVGYPLIVGYALWNLGYLAILQGEPAAAARFVDDSLAVFSETGHRRFLLRTLYSVALLGSLIELPEAAAQLLGAVGALARDQVGVLIPSERPLIDQAIATLRAKLGDAGYAAAEATGAAWTIETTLRLARRIVDHARDHEPARDAPTPIRRRRSG